MKYLDRISWVNNTNFSNNITKVLNGNLEVALSSYSISKDEPFQTISGNFNIGYLSFTSLYDIDIENPRETKVFVKHTENQKFSTYMNEFIQSIVEQKLKENEFQRRLKYPEKYTLAVVPEKAKLESNDENIKILHKAAVMRDIEAYFEEIKKTNKISQNNKDNDSLVPYVEDTDKDM